MNKNLPLINKCSYIVAVNFKNNTHLITYVCFFNKKSNYSLSFVVSNPKYQHKNMVLPKTNSYSLGDKHFIKVTFNIKWKHGKNVLNPIDIQKKIDAWSMHGFLCYSYDKNIQISDTIVANWIKTTVFFCFFLFERHFPDALKKCAVLYFTWWWKLELKLLANHLNLFYCCFIFIFTSLWVSTIAVDSWFSLHTNVLLLRF